MASNSRDVKLWLRDLKQQWWHVRATRNHHYQVFTPDGALVTTVPGSPSDWRWRKNADAALRRALAREA